MYIDKKYDLTTLYEMYKRSEGIEKLVLGNLYFMYGGKKEVKGLSPCICWFIESLSHLYNVQKKCKIKEKGSNRSLLEVWHEDDKRINDETAHNFYADVTKLFYNNFFKPTFMRLNEFFNITYQTHVDEHLNRISFNLFDTNGEIFECEDSFFTISSNITDELKFLKDVFYSLYPSCHYVVYQNSEIIKMENLLLNIIGNTDLKLKRTYKIKKPYDVFIYGE